MENQEKKDYLEILNELDNIIKNEVFKTEEEKRLIEELKTVIEKDRKNKISEYIIENNERIEELYRAVNEKLKYYIEGEGRFDNYSNRNKRIIDNLNGVKAHITSFLKRESAPDYTEENKLIEECLSYISEKPYKLPLFIDEYIVVDYLDFRTNKRYRINKQLVDRISDEIKEDNVVEDLEKGMKIQDDIYLYQKIVDKCNSSLAFKELVNNNSNLILEFNKTVNDIDKVIEEKTSDLYLGLKERVNSNDEDINKIESNSLRRIINKNRLETLYKEKEILLKRKKELQELESELVELHISLGKINSKLKDNNLTDLVTRCDLKYLLFPGEDKIAITSNLKKFESKEDIDNFFNYVEEQLKINQELLDNLLKEEKEFNNTANEQAIELINTDALEAYYLSQLNTKERNNIDPRLIFFILKTISVLNNTKVKNMNVEKSEYKELKKYNDSIISEKIVSLEDEYLDALGYYKRRR